eukprot:882614-Amphidinium_carterae.1
MGRNKNRAVIILKSAKQLLNNTEPVRFPTLNPPSLSLKQSLVKHPLLDRWVNSFTIAPRAVPTWDALKDCAAASQNNGQHLRDTQTAKTQSLQQSGVQAGP